MNDRMKNMQRLAGKVRFKCEDHKWWPVNIGSPWPKYPCLLRVLTGSDWLAKLSSQEIKPFEIQQFLKYCLSTLVLDCFIPKLSCFAHNIHSNHRKQSCWWKQSGGRNGYAKAVALWLQVDPHETWSNQFPQKFKQNPWSSISELLPASSLTNLGSDCREQKRCGDCILDKKTMILWSALKFFQGCRYK